MAAAAGDEDDVYATSDAAWLTETDEAEGDDAAADETHERADTGDRDADDRPAQDGMTDDTTDGTAPATSAPSSAAVTTTKPRTGKKGRATRPQGSAATKSVRTEPTERTGDRRPSANGKTADDRQTADDATGTEPPVRDRPGPSAKRAPRQTATKRTSAAPAPQQPVVLRAAGLVKRYGQTVAADEVDLEIRQGSIFGVVGPNGAGKTTTLSMLTGLLRPDAGTATVLDHDVWADPAAAKRSMGVLPDRLRLFDRLTGAQLLFYSATLRGLDGKTARSRSADLAEAFGLGDALGRQVADYSVGMAKKIALAATLIHSPRVLVLDEPFESVDPVSSATIVEILRRYTQGGGTVVLSSHSMELVQRTCDSVAIIVGGKVLASGTMAQVRGRRSLEDKFVELAGGRVVAESMEWLHSFSG
ncbi:ATP-binding cassette domain-containing protein [Curtobacterium sp. MCLR17_007]|uniref:ABC transporter ATP-binding protein n=1 Tax=Curtobacterium sp. MCLR17_007 TaxID=2175648 RepID=UPI0021AB9BAD|nr:ATP-binding cassette domain-containing protein [Curtobacterium sp. MCLR17_007]WIB61168.1 ATP-binding cassette domain-containing protein [Curtobacterium sp. MCLR17_007]